MKIALNQKQMDFLKSTAINTGFCAGLGSGKSFVATLKTIIKKIQHPDLTVAYYLPTYGLIRDIAFDKFPTMLSDMGYEYKLNKSDKEITIKDFGKIIFRSMDNPETIVGYEVFYSIIDECDILNQEKMTIAYNKILARNRQKCPNGTINQIDVASTPEGFRWFYQRYVKEFNPDTDLLVRASTYENKHLPDNYITNLEQQYPPNLLKAYLEGMFINLTSGTVYSYFDRKLHDTNVDAEEHEVLHIGQDFNVGGCISTVHVIRDNKVYRVNEVDSNDSFSIGANIRKKYPHNTVVMYPDASGKNGKSNANRSDIQLLRDDGFVIEAPKANGRIEDRVNACNGLFSHDRYFINVNNCPKGTEALEQQARDKNGDPEKFTGAATIDDFNDSFGYFVVRKFPIVRNTITVTTRKFT